MESNRNAPNHGRKCITDWGPTVNPFTVSGLINSAHLFPMVVVMPFRSESKVMFEWGGTCEHWGRG